MNGNNFYYNSVYETPEMRLEKKRKQRKFFSRFFIALFVYQLVFQLLSSLVYLGVNIFLSAEKYEAFVADPVASIVSSSIVQYGIALPLFLLITRGMDTAERHEKKKITFGEGVIFISIAELMMFVGNIIGNILNSSIGVLIGDTPTNNLTNIVESTPVWLLFIVMVVIAPIAEETIFRRIMIDRISIYGDHVAIIFSSVAFGLMHGNLYQFFYATLLGALLGYVYTVTREIKYTIAIHASVNFFGSILVLFMFNAERYLGTITDNAQLISTVSMLAASAYESIQLGLITAGAIALIYRHKRREIKISTDTEIYIPMRDLVKGGIINEGAILFILISLAQMVLSLFA